MQPQKHHCECSRQTFINILKMCSFHALKAVIVFKGLERCGTLGRRHGGKFVPMGLLPFTSHFGQEHNILLSRV